MTIMNKTNESRVTEKDLQVGKLYDLTGCDAIFVKADESGVNFFPIASQHSYMNEVDGLVGFPLNTDLRYTLLNMNAVLEKMITTDIHNLWLDAPKVVQDVLEKYMEEFRFDEFVALEGERVKAKKV